MASEAQIRAARENGARSSGPRDTSKTRFNAAKHYLTAKVATPEADDDAFQQRVDDYTAEMDPRTENGKRCIERMARSCVIMDRAARHETAAVAENVRTAIDRFDEGRIEEAAKRFADLANDPRDNLRKLRKSPEGVDRLVDAWTDLRADLTAVPEPIWGDEQMERAALMTGHWARHARSTRFGALSRGFRGDFGGLSRVDGGDLADPARREWARAALIKLIDAEIEALEAHRETLDFEAIERSRREAPDRALFDASKAAELARRYERDAARTYFKCAKEFRQIEGEPRRAPAPPSPAPAPRSPRPKPASPGPRSGSFREEDCTPLTDEERADMERLNAAFGFPPLPRMEDYLVIPPPKSTA